MGLDELILENSTSEEIEITLKAENASKQYILDEEKQFEFHQVRMIQCFPNFVFGFQQI